MLAAMDLVTVLLVAGATVRLTRLVVADSLPPLPAFRRWLARRLNVLNATHEPPLWTLVTCPWCLSFWIGLAVLGSAYPWGGDVWWRWLTGALTLSLLTGTYEAVMARVEE